MISYGSGAPGGIFFPLLVLGSLLFRCAVWAAGHPSRRCTGCLCRQFHAAGHGGDVYRHRARPAHRHHPHRGNVRLFDPAAQPVADSICAYLVADLCRSKPVYESLLENLHPSQQSVAQPGERIFLDLPVRYRQLCQPKTHRPGTLAQGLPHHQCRARARNPDSPRRSCAFARRYAYLSLQKRGRSASARAACASFRAINPCKKRPNRALFYASICPSTQPIFS